MWKCVAVVQFVSFNDCFAHIGRDSFKTDLNFDGNCARLSWEENSVILWCVESNVLNGCIGLNSMFAQRIGLQEGTAVCLTPCSPPSALKRVSIFPETEDDLEILESNAIKLQSCLLDQLRVVMPNQRMVIWISPSLSINIHTSQSCLLQPQTEVVVSMIKNDNTQEEQQTATKNEIVPTSPKTSPTKLNFYMTDINKLLQKYTEKTEKAIFGRVIVSSKLTDATLKCSSNAKKLFTLFIPQDKTSMQEHNVYSLRVMESISERDESQDNKTVPKIVFVHIKMTNKDIQLKEINVISKYTPVIVSKTLCNILNVNTGMKLVLQEVPRLFALPEYIEISPVITEHLTVPEDFVNNFKMFISSQFTEDNPLLINDGFIIDMSPFKNLSCQVNLFPKSLKYLLLHGEVFRHCKVVASNEAVQPFESIDIQPEILDPEEICKNVDSFEKIIDKSKEIFKCQMLMAENQSNRFTSNRSHIFITGAPGSGKTTVCKRIANDLGLWYMCLECRSIKGKKEIIEYFQRVIQLCEEHSPSILICDDIESIIPVVNEGATQQDAAFYDSLVYSIRDLLRQCMGVGVLLTSTRMEDVNEGFKVTKGQLLFPFQFSIPELSMSERVQLLKCLARNSLYSTDNIKENDYNQMAIETNGFTARDLCDYITKRLYKAIKHSVSSKKWLLNLETKTNSDNDITHNNREHIWDTLGGMNHIKETLIEILCWPLKYPNLFPKQPGGVLLFGPPGTGKSLIGSCVAKLTQISFICVKGPELLSKYIGQSEQAVRNLFEKAEKKKPCVLFFDEFDSLAPRRGHDSTGVTDRVVNQLLTQLDGVEGAIKGVTVLAATSRPDLLDGALLRPGRFDTTIHCSMPNHEDRLEILRILSDGLNVSDDLKLEELAEMTEGFTGADLKAVLSTAQLQCLEEEIDKLTSQAEGAGDAVVTRTQLMDALANTRPSLTPQQLRFYDRIYARFLNKSSPEDNTAGELVHFRQRATLA